MGWMALAMLLAAIVVAAVVGVIAVAAVRAGRRRGEADDRSARSLLDQRLATGEIDAEEYFEREAALRSAEPRTRAPRRRGNRG
jgi:uncharacterized membrane protein